MMPQPTSLPVAVRIEDLTFHYPDGTAALDQLSLTIDQDESVCLAGPNGAGKSTLLLILAGLMKGQGKVEIEGLPPQANQQLGLVFQDADDQLFCPTVGEDVAFGPLNQKLAHHEVETRVRKSLAATGMTGFEQRSAHHLSGGEKKRAAIAAVLACRPSVLAFDEPWANLDARGAHAVTRIVREFDGTRLITSQDLARAAQVCSRLLILDHGKLVADGPMDQLLDDSALLEQHGLEFIGRCEDCQQRLR